MGRGVGDLKNAAAKWAFRWGSKHKRHGTKRECSERHSQVQEWTKSCIQLPSLLPVTHSKKHLCIYTRNLLLVL